MKLKSFIALACLSLFVFSSCGNEDDPVIPESQNNKTKKLSFTPAPRGSWAYVNLETGEVKVEKDVNEWIYKQGVLLKDENGNVVKDEKGNPIYKKDKDGNIETTIVKTIPASEPNAPAVWHLAFHDYNVCTNDAAVLMTDKTDINAFKEMPMGEYAEDKNATIIVDMKGMMSVPFEIGCANTKANFVLGKWLVSKGMPPVRTMSDKVFSVRFKNGDYVLIKFKDYKDPTGKSKLIVFDYKLVKKTTK